VILTRDKLREAGAAEGFIDILMKRWPDGIPPTKEALIQANDMGLDLMRVGGGLIDWSKWPRSQGIIRDAYKLYQEALEEERAKVDAAQRRYQEVHAEALANLLAPVECEPEQDARAEQGQLTAEVIGVAMQAIKRVRNCALKDDAKGTNPFYHLGITSLLDKLDEVSVDLEFVKDYVEESNNG